MKIGSRDKAYKIMITGIELEELKRHTGDMAESFGLDSRIDRYRGARPIGLYRWDLGCLTDVLEMVLRDKHEYPDKSSQGYKAAQALYERLTALRNKAYNDLERS
jgi:hypothetical protein